MKQYEIWDAIVRYEDDDGGAKQRPVLIWGEFDYVAAYKMTGTDRGDTGSEFKVEFWREAGLDKPTTIRIHKLLKLTKTDLVSYRGMLDRRDRIRFEMRLASK